jgi:hypothetical protein
MKCFIIHTSITFYLGNITGFINRSVTSPLICYNFSFSRYMIHKNILQRTIWKIFDSHRIHSFYSIIFSEFNCCYSLLFLCIITSAYFIFFSSNKNKLINMSMPVMGLYQLLFIASLILSIHKHTVFSVALKRNKT